MKNSVKIEKLPINQKREIIKIQVTNRIENNEKMLCSIGRYRTVEILKNPDFLYTAKNRY